jgi:hypothetical protein
MLYKKGGMLIALLAFAGSVSAGSCEHANSNANENAFTNPSCSNYSVGAPEIDPASAVSGVTLLLGGLAVIRGRRKRS